MPDFVFAVKMFIISKDALDTPTEKLYPILTAR